MPKMDSSWLEASCKTQFTCNDTPSQEIYRIHEEEQQHTLEVGLQHGNSQEITMLHERQYLCSVNRHNVPGRFPQALKCQLDTAKDMQIVHDLLPCYMF